MAYLKTRAAQREGIARWYPEAKAVLVLGFLYASNEPEASIPGRGKVARYARLPDYHDSLKKKLIEILDWVKGQRPGLDGRVFVDTSPILERAYARLAGLGWIGKNTMLINPKRGSYFFIAGIAINTSLPCDSGDDADHCGSCTRCLDACPTDAFPKERVLDASRCISYLTIEHRGAIDAGLRAGVGDWAFGCDICQEVCPWNRFAESGRAFPAGGEASLDLERTAALDEAGFKKAFRESPLSRAKRRGLVRNALLVMGNSGDARHRPALERFLDDADPVLREQAQWSLARLPAEIRS
jgi:epoxyqueuosine reductase